MAATTSARGWSGAPADPSTTVHRVLVRTLALLLLGLTLSAARPATALPEAVDYVALGDSYTAGPLIPDPTGGGCVRSTGNYPAQLATLLEVTTYTDVSCSGARHGHLRHEQQVFGGGTVPPQYDALTAETDLVTLGMGGNDFGLFGSIVSMCPQVRERNPDGSPCRREFTRLIDGQRVDILARDARRIEEHVARGVRGILLRAPQAEVFVVGYPRLLPEEGTCEQVPFATGDYAWGRHLQWLLNRSLRQGAEREGATYVNLYPTTRGHDACAGDQAWVNGAALRLGEAAPYHPFLTGMTNAAGVLEAAVTAP